MTKPKRAAQPDDDLIAMVRLSDLIVSDMNPRQVDDPADIAALAASIEACGLMQNLSGYADPGRTDGQVEIVDGKRRLLALQMIAAEPGKQMRAADPMVPVAITLNRSQALAWAGAGNTSRKALHPVDEIRAYARMAEGGADPNAIARAFAVTERQVRQRLKLADLPMAILSALRNGKISLDQAQAFTLARSSDDAETILQKVLTEHWTVRPQEIRTMLRGDRISATDRKAAFVGLDDYEAAGGDLQRDLFSDAIWLDDAALLDRLFVDKLARAAAEEAATGWASVRVFENSQPDYDVLRGMTKIQRVPVELPEADMAELETLSERGNRDEFTEAEAARFDELEARAGGDFAPEDRADAILWLYVDYHGRLNTFGPWKPAAPVEDDDAIQVDTVKEKPLSQSVVADLGTIRLMALQWELAQSPSLALDILAWQLARRFAGWESPLSVTVNFEGITLEKPEGYDIPPGILELDDIDRGKVKAGQIDDFLAFRQLGLVHRDRVIAKALARSLRRSDFAPWLGFEMMPDPRQHWTPTKTGYLSRIPQSHLDAIWTDLVPDDRTPSHAGFRSVSKAEKVDLLHRLFGDADYREMLGLDRDQNHRIASWLPAEMTWGAADNAPDAEGDD